MRWFVLVFVASCYSPASYSNCGVSCATGLDCPTGQSCFDNRCSAEPGQCAIDAMTSGDEAMIDSSSNVDLDGDGILNDLDKCPTVNSQDNRDHDGDGLGDPCDPCPMYTNNTDTDGDKVGDLCDPRPTMAGDVRAAFYGFYDAMEYTTWTKVGTWTITSGRADGSNLNLGGASFEGPTVFAANVAVFAEVSIKQLGADPVLDKFAGISMRRVSADHQDCEVGSRNAGSFVRMRKYIGGSLTDNENPYTGTLFTDHRMVGIANGTSLSCSADSQAIGGAVPSQAGKVALDASIANTSTDWLFVVTMP